MVSAFPSQKHRGKPCVPRPDNILMLSVAGIHGLGALYITRAFLPAMLKRGNEHRREGIMGELDMETVKRPKTLGARIISASALANNVAPIPLFEKNGLIDLDGKFLRLKNRHCY